MSKNNGVVERQKYIDGYKGIACFCIMLGHFCGLYKYSEDVGDIRNKFMIIMTSKPMSFFTDENFWLSFFMLISGYLCYKSSYNKVDSFSGLIKQLFARFIRLAGPVFISGIIVYIIQQTIGFHSRELDFLIHNKMFSEAYVKHLGVVDVLVNPFKTLFIGISDFISPHWCLKDILSGTCMIYLACYLSSRQEILKKEVAFASMLAVLSVIMMIMRKPLIIVVLMGAFLDGGEKLLEKYIKRTLVINILLFLTPLIAFVFNTKSIVDAMCWGLSLIGVKNIGTLNKMMSKTFLSNIGGAMSWGIFSYHYPVICSFTAITFLSLFGHVTNTCLFIICLMISIIITVAISLVDLKMFDPITKRAVCIIKNL